MLMVLRYFIDKDAVEDSPVGTRPSTPKNSKNRKAVSESEFVNDVSRKIHSLSNDNISPSKAEHAQKEPATQNEIKEEPNANPTIPPTFELRNNEIKSQQSLDAQPHKKNANKQQSDHRKTKSQTSAGKKDGDSKIKTKKNKPSSTAAVNSSNNADEGMIYDDKLSVEEVSYAGPIGFGHGHAANIPTSYSSLMYMVLVGDGPNNIAEGLALGAWDLILLPCKQ